MAGVSAAKIPTDNVDYANYLLAQMPSVGGLGKNYILGPFRERIAGYVFRIVATQDNTFVSISHGKPIELHAGEMFHQDIVSNNITQISSDRPILVVQYNKGYAADSVRGNAAMVVVPAVEMFSSTTMRHISVKNQWKHEIFEKYVKHTIKNRWNKSMKKTVNNLLKINEIKVRLS